MTRCKLWFVIAALCSAAAPAAAVDYLFVQPAAGTTGNWSTSAWVPSPPTGSGSATDTITYATLGGNANAFTLTNDVGAFTVNSLTFARYGTGLFTQALGANPLTLDGTNPAFNLAGPGSSVISGAGGVALPGNTSVLGSGNGYLSIAGVVSGAGSITVNQSGLGIFSLTGTNTFNGGGVTLTNGTLQLGSAAALGAAANTLTVNGGALRFSAASTIPNSITANSTLVISGGTGALTATSTPILTGAISGAGGLTLQSVATTAGVTLQGSNSYAGATLVQSYVPANPASSAPTLTLSGLGGVIGSTAQITVGRNATLALTDTLTTINSNRVPDSAPLLFNSGRLTINGVAGTNETFGNVTATGSFALSITATGGASVYNFGTFTPLDKAVVNLNSPYVSAGSTSTSFGAIPAVSAGVAPVNYAKVFFSGGLPTLSAGSGTGTELGIVPFVTAGGSTTNPRQLATYDATNGLQSVPYTNSDYFVQVANSAQLLAAANKNVTITTAGTYDLAGGNLTVNSLANFASGSTYQNGTLKVFSGAVVNYDPFTWNNITLDFGTNTGYILAGWQQKFTGTANITGSAGVVFGGQGAGATYTAGFETTVANTFAGGLWVNGNTTLGFRAENQLGAAGGTVTLGGGYLSYNAAANVDIPRPVVLGPEGGGVTFGVVGSSAAATTHTAATVVTLSGVVSGSGAFFKEGTGVVNLANGSNTYSGGTVVTAGTLQFTADANLGNATGRLTLNGGTVQPLAAVTVARGIDVNASSTILAANALTLSGPITNVGNLYGTAVPTLTKSGAGVLTVTGDGSKFNGNIAVTAGGLTLSGTGGTLSQANTVVVSAGAALTIDNTSGLNSNRLGDAAAVSLGGAGSVFNYIAGSTATTDPAERFGVLTSSVAGSVFTITGSSASATTIRVGFLNATAPLTIRGTDLGGTSGNYTRLLIESFASNVSILPNVFFANTAGTATSTVAAGYDTVRGVIQFSPTPTSGTSINNFAPDNVPLSAAYTTTGDATAATGAQVYSLTLDVGSSLTLNGGNAASGTNGNTADGTLLIAGGLLTSQNGPKSITSGAARTVSFGGSLGVVTTNSNLTLEANVGLAGSGGLAKEGGGTFTLNGPYSVTGPLAINAGTVATTNALSVPGLTGTGTLDLGATGSLQVNAATASAFSGTLTGGTTLTKSGTSDFTFGPSNTPTYAGGTFIENGTLLLGSAGGATAVLGNFTLGSAVGNTPGSLDVNGYSPAGTVTGFGLAGTSTGHRIFNSNSGTPSTVSLNLPGDVTAPLAVGGNMVINKNDANLLVLTGTVAPPASPTGVINVNAGTFRITSGTPVGAGMSFTVAPAATLDFGAFGNNNTDAGAFGTMTNNGGTLQVASGSGDLATNKLNLNGGGMTFSGTTNFWWHFRNAGAGINVTGGAAPVAITGPTSGSRIQNDTAAALPINVSRGTAAVDLDTNVLFSASGTNANFSKTGNGIMQISYVGVNGIFAVNGGVLQVATPGTLTATTTSVNAGGTLRGSGTVAGVSVNDGGTLQGGTGTSTGALTTGAVTITGGNALRAVVGNGNLSSLVNAGSNAFNAGTGTPLMSVVLVNDGSLLLDGTTSNTVTLATFGSTNIPFDGGGLPTANLTIGLPEGFSYAGTPSLSLSSTQLQITFVAQPVPEPATVLAVAAVGLGLGRAVRRRFKK